MLGFPVQRSTLLISAVQRHVEEVFGLSVSRCRLYKQTSSDLYLLESGELLYLYRIWSKELSDASILGAQLKCQETLSEKGLPVALPLKNLSGSYLSPLNAPEGLRFGALFPYLPGEPAGRAISPEQSFVLGQLLAEFHSVGDTLGSRNGLREYDGNTFLAEPLGAIRRQPALQKGQLERLERLVSRLQERLAVLNKTTPVYGLCHGDVHGMNVLFDDQKLSLLDFDCLGYTWRAFDLAVFVWWVRGVALEGEVRRRFLEGYGLGYPHADQVTPSVSLFVPIRHLVMTKIIIDNAERGRDVGRWLDATFFDKRIEFIETWTGREQT